MKNKQDGLGVVSIWALTGLIFLLIAGIPAWVVFLFGKDIPWELSLAIVGVGVVTACFAAARFWEKNVPQNPELTTTLVRNPDGSMVPITNAGPIYTRPGSVIEGNQLGRNIKSVLFEFKVNRGKVSLSVKGTLRYYLTDGKGLSEREQQNMFATQNRLGTLLTSTVEETIRGNLERSGDVVSQGPDFKSLEDLLNHKGRFLNAVETHFRMNFEKILQLTLGIEIVDKNEAGISLALNVPEKVEAELLSLYQQEQQAEITIRVANELMKTAKEAGQTLPLAEALDQAAAIISGNIQRITGKGARGATTFIQPGIGAGDHGN